MNTRTCERIRLEVQETRHPSIRLSFFFAFVVVLVFQACCSPLDSERANEDRLAGQWIRNWEFRYDWQQIRTWSEVDEQNTSRAVDLLREKPFMEISKIQAAQFSRGAVPPSGDSVPFLMRAVGPSDGQFPLDVYTRTGGDVWVAGGAIGRCPIARRRRAVIAWLAASPRNIYNTFSAAR